MIFFFSRKTISLIRLKNKIAKLVSCICAALNAMDGGNEEFKGSSTHTSPSKGISCKAQTSSQCLAASDGFLIRFFLSLLYSSHEGSKPPMQYLILMYSSYSSCNFLNSGCMIQQVEQIGSVKYNTCMSLLWASSLFSS